MFTPELMAISKFFPETSIAQVAQKLDTLDPQRKQMAVCYPYKDPLISLIISLVAGGLGIDRFYIGDTMLGIIKLITCGGFGIWALIDLFLIMSATKEKNLQTFMMF